jgi:cyclopropane-fatty-acyl-phospholipid synthase
MVDQMGAQPGDHVLEIGCGWGGFAEYAAKERGLKVTGLTISREQHDYAVARMERAGPVGPGGDQAAGLPRRAGHL